MTSGLLAQGIQNLHSCSHKHRQNEQLYRRHHEHHLCQQPGLGCTSLFYEILGRVFSSFEYVSMVSLQDFTLNIIFSL